MLCGAGAKKYAASRGLKTAGEEEGFLVTEEQRAAWKRYRGMVHRADMQRGPGGWQEQPQQPQQQQQQQQQQSSLHQQAETLDTVGSIAIDSFGRVSAGVSSGDLH